MVSTAVSENVSQRIVGSGLRRRGMTCVVLWMVWKNRNDVVWNHSNASAADLAGAYKSSFSMRPSPGVMKCNVDASLLQAMDKLGAGWVLRSSYGEYVEACRLNVWSYGPEDC
ncbi:hypothetical protein GH714_025569 [Hevea brasiliensis]|uniref:RNase H type-1 domain-containing protein n=1 Tax=Hevea brasiliensis TaxID=3981 RepID=A0A6A6MWU9_HEVBR|nr:hypothetical protein GH714_025569 [Hevea brasiliensis]